MAALYLSAAGMAQAGNLHTELSAMMGAHPLHLAAEQDLLAAEKQTKVSSSARLPTVSISADAGYEDQERPDGVEQSLNPQNSLLAVRQLLWDFGATGNTIEASKFNEKQASSNRDQVRQDLLQTGVQAYFNLVVAAERYANVKESLDRVAERKAIEERKLSAGKGSQADVLQADSQRLGAEARVVQAKGALSIAINTYRQVFGKAAPQLSQLERQRVASAGMPDSVADAIAGALRSNPALKSSYFASQAAASRTDASKASNYYPRFEVAAESERREDSGGVEGEITENRLLLRLTYDFDLGFSQRHEVAAARAKQSAAEYNREQQERVTREAVENAWQRYQTALKSLDIARQQLDKASAFLDLAEKERELGRRSLQDILNGELIRVNAKTTLAQARAELSVASFAILRSMGELDLGDFN